MKLDSYWLDTAPAFGGASQEGLGGRTDVVVIGGGFTGLSAALALAKAGASVSVLESGRVVGEASGRNGGQCNEGTLQDYRKLIKTVGPERALSYYRAYSEAVNTVEQLVSNENIECGFRRCGKLKLAAKPSHFEGLTQTCEALQNGADTNVVLVTPDRIRDEVDSASFHGGLLQTNCAQLHVGKFGIGLAGAAARHGANIFEHAQVTALKRQPNRDWRVTTPRGTIDATQVLVATGGSGPGPFGWFRRRIVPVGSFIVVTEPLDITLLDRILPNRRCYVTTKNIGNYFLTTPDNRLLFGGRARFDVSTPKTDRESAEILKKTMTNLFPVLAGTRIDYCWGGSVDMSADRLPRAGEHEGLFYSMGYSGHGVQMAVHMGQVMAEVMDGREDSNPWKGLKWPAIPGHFGKPWFLPAVGAYYRMLDILS